MQIVLVDPTDIERLNAKVFADTVTLMNDVVARLDITEMRDFLAVVAVMTDGCTALMTAEDILLGHDDQACRRHLKTSEQCSLANVYRIIAQGLCFFFNERRDAPMSKEFAQAVRLFFVTKEHEYLLFLREPAVGLVLQKVHLAAERRHRRRRHADVLARLSALHLLQQKCR